jgi:Predicted metal-dependent hydrolase with the TIM-barrel fold
MHRHWAAFTALGALLLSPLAAAQLQLISAREIVTGNPDQPQVQAMVIDGQSGRVLALGEKHTLQARYPQASAHDLGQATVIPGLIDAHAHLVNLGHGLSEANLWGVRSKQEVIARLQAAEAQLAPGQWLIGRGWDQNLWPEKPSPAPLIWMPRFRTGRCIWTGSMVMRPGSIRRRCGLPRPRGARWQATGIRRVAGSSAMPLASPPAC